MNAPVTPLTALCATLPLLSDLDGDGLPDALQVRIVIGARAAQAEAIAAMHLAARLAFETLALREPVSVVEGETAPSSRVSLFIGRPETVAANCPPAMQAMLRSLRPAEGAIAVDRIAHAVLVGGADPAGLAAAALAFCREWIPTAALGPDDSPTSAVVRIPAGDGLPVDTPEAALPHAPAVSSLAELFGAAGFARDTDGDLLPDHFTTRVTVPDDLSAPEIVAAVQFAARLGLETLGLTVPFAFADAHVAPEPGALTVRIAPLSRHAADTAPKRASIRLRDDAGFGQILTLQSSDPRSRAAALQELARLDLWDAGRPSLAAIERALTRLCAIADPGAVLCAAAVALRYTTGTRENPAFLRCPPHLAAHREALSAAIHRFAFPHQPPAQPAVHLDPGTPPPVFDVTEQFTWEVDEAWQVLQQQILPALATLPADDAGWSIDLRLSEPEGRRARIKGELLALIRASGRAAHSHQVRVLPAYRQGLGWLLEEVMPVLLHAKPARVQVRVARFTPAVPSLELPIRWLQDLFPVDELLAARLDLPIDAIALVLVEQDPTYVVEAFDAAGAVLVHQELVVVHGQRPYLQRFPDWGTVHPSTGCARLLYRDTALVEARISPDPERVWNALQESVLPRLETSIRAACDGEPRRDLQPFFGDLTFDVWLSEEDAAIGVREERNSPLESLQEDLYFTVLDFCTALISAGDGYLPPWLAPDQPSRGPRHWTAPGRVVPRIHRRDGAAGRMRVQLTPATGPRTALRYRHNGAEEPEPLSGATGVACVITGMDLALAGEEPIGKRDLIVALRGPADQQARAAALLEAWGALRHAVPALVEDLPAECALTIERDGQEPLRIPAVALEARAEGPSVPASADLQTGSQDRILGIPAIEAKVAALQESPQVRAYRAGHSAQGRPSYAVELTVPRTTGWWSQARLSAWKCSLLLSARHHANEPSSTNALLELARLLAEDPRWRRTLDRVNVVIVPGENPDGMALYDQLVDEHPTWMHHAARYNAAGLEFAAEYADPLTTHTEALVLPGLWQRWVPDIVCDDHGFPAHEWLQLFAGHGNPWFQDYWIAQGLIFTYLQTVRGERYPRHRQAMDSLRERIIQVLAADPEVALWNAAHAGRYRTYLQRWEPDRFPAPYDRDVLVHVRAQDPDNLPPTPGSAVGLPARFPGVSTATLITEVADESAQGTYLQLCARAHRLIDQALIEYLYEANAPALIDRRRVVRRDGTVVLTATRPRPVLVPASQR